MVSTTEILPCSPLQPFVRCYTLREFDTFGIDFIKPLPAIHEISFAFSLTGSISTAKTNFKEVKANSRKHIVGLQTASGGSIIFNGNIKHFTIQFKPNGFYALFGIPSSIVTNQAFEASEIFGKEMDIFNDKLNQTKDISSMKKVSDEFLMSFFLKSKTINQHNSISQISSVIFKNPSNVDIKKLACDANMSLRNFEMKFARQVGLSPKMFARITRFNATLSFKMKDMKRSWTDISHRCGYYDQMHFIKEFKEFAGESPVNFFRNTPLPHEDYKQHPIK